MQTALTAILLMFGAAAAYAQVAVPSPPTLSQVAPQAPSMRLNGQFTGPFQDTLIQRWQDSSTGVTCYLYIPVMVPWSSQQPSPTGQGSVRQYGPNQLGSISCVPAVPISSSGSVASRP